MKTEMSIKEAQQTIRNIHAGPRLWLIASIVLADAVNDNEVTNDDFLQCLMKGGPIAENAARALHQRTNRPRIHDKGLDMEVSIRNVNDWEQYLKSRRVRKVIRG